MPTTNSITNNFFYPKDIPDFVQELLFENTLHSQNHRNKTAGLLISDPGIGKTSSIKLYPYYSLQKENNERLAAFVAENPKFKSLQGFEFKYYPETIDTAEWENSVIKQTVEQLKAKGISELDEILNVLLKYPFVAVVTATQADFLSAEDISGLLSSNSDLKQIESMSRIVEYLKRHSNVDKTPSFNEKALEYVDAYMNSDKTKSDLRNISKFDMTEWEEKIWNYEKDPNIKYIILLLDDITRTTNILNVLMPMFQEGMVGQRKLPINCSVILTSNDSSSESGFNNLDILDDGQSDRVIAKYISFDFESWAEHARTKEQVHDFVILFLETNRDIVSNRIISPRKLSQLGQAITYRFGESFSFYDNPEDKEKLLKILRHHLLGNPKNKLDTIYNSMLAFFDKVGKEVTAFVHEFFTVGFTENLKKKMAKFNENGDITILATIAHKLNEFMFNNALTITESQAKSYSDFYMDMDKETSLPLHIKYTVLSLVHKTGVLGEKKNKSEEERKKFLFLYDLSTPICEFLSIKREEEAKKYNGSEK